MTNYLLTWSHDSTDINFEQLKMIKHVITSNYARIDEVTTTEEGTTFVLSSPYTLTNLKQKIYARFPELTLKLIEKK